MNNLRITWIGQSGYILNDGNTEICIDPYLSDLAERICGQKRLIPSPVQPEKLKSDVVMCTHRHIDHMDTDSITKMEKENKIFLAPSDACSISDIHMKAFDEGDLFRIGNFTIRATFADHTVPAIGVMIEHSGIKLYFSGDTYYNDKLCQLKEENLDVVFICINGRLGNMDVTDAIKLTSTLNPKAAVPNHYGMFADNTEDPQKYISKVKNGFEMTIGKEYTISEVIENV